MAVPFVSVIIPVYNDAARLYKCVEALSRQTYPDDRYEIVVVDNASTEPLQLHNGLVTLLTEHTPGSYAARNTGIRASRGELIAFTDADCLPHEGWIEAGVQALSGSDRPDIVGGRIDLFFRDQENLSAVEIYESVRGFPQERYVNEQHFSVTANMFTSRRVLDAVGLFDDSSKSGSDYAFGKKAHALGYSLKYGDDVVVAHPSRATFAELRKKTERVTLDVSNRGPAFIIRSFLRLLVPPVDAIREGMNSRHIDGLSPLMKYIGVVYYVRATVIKQRIRLLLGGEAAR